MALTKTIFSIDTTLPFAYTLILYIVNSETTAGRAREFVGLFLLA